MAKYDKSLYQSLKEIDDYKQRKRKIDALKGQLKVFPVITVLQGSFDDRINLEMPAGTPPLEPREDEDLAKLPTVMEEKSYKQFGTFADKSIHQWKREKNFTSFLCAIPEEDIPVIIAMKDKKLTEIFPSITKELVKEAIPELKLK